MIIEQTKYGSLRIFVVFFQQLLYSLQVSAAAPSIIIYI